MNSRTDLLTQRVSLAHATSITYDLVIVGSGVSGAVIAHEIAKYKKEDPDFRILILEAGPGKNMSLSGYEKYLENFYTAVAKDNNAPFPANPNAPMPRSHTVERKRIGVPNTGNYLVQNGPWISDTSYVRVLGGTTSHWESKTPRMLATDFKMKSLYGQGRDWPITYRELLPYYRKAEREIGIAGSVAGQKAIGIEFAEGYVFPMKELPPSYLDQVVAKGVDGMEVELEKERFTIKVETFPQGRNAIPNPDYANFVESDGTQYEPFVPEGAVSLHQAEAGERCQGNTNCTPLCPVQAKYDARKTLAKALLTERVDLMVQAVASTVHVDQESQRVTGITVKKYEDFERGTHQTGEIKGKTFVLAANAIENARLMLASGLPGRSDQMGRNLMDHPYVLAWSLLPEDAGTMRGTSSTSGISNLRDGAFRAKQAAFAADIHNDGWGWATGAPYTDLLSIVDGQNKFGKALREELVRRVSRQFLLAFMVEMPALPENRVTVNPAYRDQLGNMRPVIDFTVPAYSLNGIAYGREFSRRLFQRLGAEDYTAYDPLDYGYVAHGAEGFAIRGGNHIAGTHVMGDDPNTSVVDENQRSWDYPNLYLVGPGSMPTIGTSNTTLTSTAMCFKTVEAMLAEL